MPGVLSDNSKGNRQVASPANMAAFGGHQKPALDLVGILLHNILLDVSGSVFCVLSFLCGEKRGKFNEFKNYLENPRSA